jgi:hypothetical protein
VLANGKSPSIALTPADTSATSQSDAPGPGRHRISWHGTRGKDLRPGGGEFKWPDAETDGLDVQVMETSSEVLETDDLLKRPDAETDGPEVQAMETSSGVLETDDLPPLIKPITNGSHPHLPSALSEDSGHLVPECTWLLWMFSRMAVRNPPA